LRKSNQSTKDWARIFISRVNGCWLVETSWSIPEN